MAWFSGQSGELDKALCERCDPFRRDMLMYELQDQFLELLKEQGVNGAATIGLEDLDMR